MFKTDDKERYNIFKYKSGLWLGMESKSKVFYLGNKFNTDYVIENFANGILPTVTKYPKVFETLFSMIKFSPGMSAHNKHTAIYKQFLSSTLQIKESVDKYENKYNYIHADNQSQINSIGLYHYPDALIELHNTQSVKLNDAHMNGLVKFPSIFNIEKIKTEFDLEYKIGKYTREDYNSLVDYSTLTMGNAVKTDSNKAVSELAITEEFAEHLLDTAAEISNYLIKFKDHPELSELARRLHTDTNKAIQDCIESINSRIVDTNATIRLYNKNKHGITFQDILDCAKAPSDFNVESVFMDISIRLYHFMKDYSIHCKSPEFSKKRLMYVFSFGYFDDPRMEIKEFDNGKFGYKFYEESETNNEFAPKIKYTISKHSYLTDEDGYFIANNDSELAQVYNAHNISPKIFPFYIALEMELIDSIKTKFILLNSDFEEIEECYNIGELQKTIVSMYNEFLQKEKALS